MPFCVCIKSWSAHPGQPKKRELFTVGENYMIEEHGSDRIKVYGPGYIGDLYMPMTAHIFVIDNIYTGYYRPVSTLDNFTEYFSISVYERDNKINQILS